MRTNKKKRLRPQTKSGHVKFWPTAVADCSPIAEYGERDGDLQGALDSPPGGRVEPWIGFMGRGDPAYAVCFLSQISPDVWLLSGSEVTCPFRKNAEEQNNQGATFFCPSSTSSFRQCQKARASHPPLVHEVGLRSCEALPGSS